MAADSPLGPAGLEAQAATVARAAALALAQPQLLALEREQAKLKLGRALTLLLEPLTPQERRWIDTFEANLDRLRYKSAFALGPVASNRHLQLGFGSNRDLTRIAHQEAMDFCGGSGPREACRIVYSSGQLDGPAFVEAVRAGMGSDFTGYRQAWRRDLARVERNPNFPGR